jgi:sec-independent protein translocase protein TatB
MFGIDFSEILVIFVIALVVLGPERLPKLASTIGRWLGRARGMARQFREQLEQEASRLQHETKSVQDSIDLNAAAQQSTTQSQPPPPVSSETAATAAHQGAAPEFGLHNAGAPEPPASQPPPSGAGAAPEEPAVAVEAHERRV